MPGTGCSATLPGGVAQAVGVPPAVGEQVLQAVWGGVAGVVGELPAVLAADRAEQSADVGRTAGGPWAAPPTAPKPSTSPY